MISAEREEQNTWGSGLLLFLTLLWVLAGIAAFIVSLICFGRSGSNTTKIFGFILAVLFGPFYWIYFAVSSNYCKRKKTTPRGL